jgi:predicted RNA-binding protein with PIN domain
MAIERLIIVDGYNVILRSPRLKPGGERTLRESREMLVNLLSWAIGGADAQFLVVFDGAERGDDERSGRVAVRFARLPEKADDLIRRIVEEQMPKVERITVVTSDLEVARHARAMGADVAMADLFLASMLDPSAPTPTEKPVTMSKKELQEWAELFSRKRDSEDDDEELPN